MNTNMHVTQRQAATMLAAVRYRLNMDVDYGQEFTDLKAAETMLVAALARISDRNDRRDKKGVWA